MGSPGDPAVNGGKAIYELAHLVLRFILLKLFLEPWRAEAPATARSIVCQYFTCVITMAGGSWALTPAAALIQTLFLLKDVSWEREKIHAKANKAVMSIVRP